MTAPSCSRRLKLAAPEARKTAHRSIAERNRTIDRIVRAIDRNDRFVVVGHRHPDEDCVASMVAMAIILTKFSKDVRVLLPDPVSEQCTYLIDICRHNSIRIDEECCDEFIDVDALVVCDTAKPEMIAPSVIVDALFAERDVLRIEIDHHLETDSVYSGSPGYRLVDEATSTAELVGVLAIKMQRYAELIDRYHVKEILSRNLVLAILTGIIGDTKLGSYFSSERVRRAYGAFTRFYNRLLRQMTTKDTNFFTMTEVFEDLQRLSSDEAACYADMMSRKQIGRYVGLVLLDKRAVAELSSHFDWETISSVSRAAADALAEITGYVGLLGYVDDPERSALVQFRLRRSRSFTELDLRDVIEHFSIVNGGGHQGAVAFRFRPDEVDDLEALAARLVAGVDELIEARIAGTG